MVTFHYKAIAETGAMVTGSIDAASEAAVIQHLRAQGHYPISATEARVHDWSVVLRETFRLRRGFSSRDLAIVTQELATLLRAGLELDRALALLSKLGEAKGLRGPLGSILAKIRGGAGFADALAAERGFPKLYISMVRAGEIGGTLEATLHRLGEYLIRAQAVRDEIASALVYPVILLGTSGLSIIVILVFVLPQFEPLFAEAGKTLPLATRMVMAIGHFLGSYWWLLLSMAVAGVISFQKLLRDASFRKRRDNFLLRLPLIGDLILKIELERFGRTLGTLLGNGVALPTALGITSDTLSNSVLAEAAGEAATRLREGETLAGRLARAKIFPSLTLDLIRVGEESGKLDEMLIRQADLYERNVKHTVDRLLALLVPALTLFLGIIVAGLIASILVAILSVNQLAI